MKGNRVLGDPSVFHTSLAYRNYIAAAFPSDFCVAAAAPMERYELNYWSAIPRRKMLCETIKGIEV